MLGYVGDPELVRGFTSELASDQIAGGGELGIDPAGVIGLERLLVNLTDHVGQPGVADRSFGWRSLPPSIEASCGDPEDAAGPFDGATLIGEFSDQGEAFLWGHHRLPLLGSTVEVGSTVEDKDLLLELTDTTPRGGQSSRLRR